MLPLKDQQWHTFIIYAIEMPCFSIVVKFFLASEEYYARKEVMTTYSVQKLLAEQNDYNNKEKVILHLLNTTIATVSPFLFG